MFYFYSSDDSSCAKKISKECDESILDTVESTAREMCALGIEIFNLKKRTKSCTQKYPVSVWIIRAGFFELKTTIQCTPRSERSFK